MSDAPDDGAGPGRAGPGARRWRRVELRRSGGILGRTLVVEIDAEELDEGDAAELDRLLAEAGLLDSDGPAISESTQAPGADRYRYAIRVVLQQGERSVEFSEGSPAAQRFAKLVRFLLERARGRDAERTAK